jgi:ABC-type transport system involved in Fe-S cluster assembly fused permease/ATPase subunit
MSAHVRGRACPSVWMRLHLFSYVCTRARQGLSVHVPAGTSCAFVGTSGSGKSTILRLLFRFYDADAGSVLVGGRDVRDVTMASLRQAIAQVPQVRVRAPHLELAPAFLFFPILSSLCRCL